MFRKNEEIFSLDYLAPLVGDETVQEGGSCRYSLKRFAYFLMNLVPYGGFLSAAFNLASATLGAGIISLPSAFNFSGIILSLLLLFTVTLATIYAIRLLVESRELTDLTSYEAMARAFFGPGWDYFIASVMWLFTFGTCVAYIISIGDILDTAFASDSVPSFLRTQSGKRIMTSVIWFVGMFTMSLPKHINSLRYASGLAICCIFFFIACIVVHALQNGFKEGKLRDDVKLWKSGNAVVEGLSLFMFAYLCQVNCFEIYAEMTEPTVNKMTLYAAFSMFMCFVAYSASGFFGYADFGSEVTGSVLLHYDVNRETLFAVSFGGIAVKLCVGFALNVQPARDSCYYLLGWNLQTIPMWKHIIFCGSMSFAALLLGLFIPTVNTVFGLLGSLCGGLLGFCLPALYRMYCGQWGLKEVGIVNFVCTYLLLFAGVVAVVFGTGASIYGVFIP
ncbi:putative amino acid transporter PAT4 [Trypanosoma grayi]|uniref:putative amino acid transporter PAT4 n=1 Tax=Trypanosoma grayi TaxID=71804 RepID=UPI0004F447D4|nr:putative amino acid transporter PAT4 [Trypanosoma grayi]KEG06977.1 putative amino acid transporter PAT4 [Trypanosoma grayi]